MTSMIFVVCRSRCVCYKNFFDMWPKVHSRLVISSSLHRESLAMQEKENQIFLSCCEKKMIMCHSRSKTNLIMIMSFCNYSLKSVFALPAK